MRRFVLLLGFASASLSAGCASPGGNSGLATYSCQPTLGPRSGEFYMFAPTRDAQGYTTCGTGHG